MKTARQIRQLEQQRDEHLRQAAHNFSQLKRDLRRASSPKRMIRKHMAASIGTAFAAGIFLAPAPRRPSTPNSAPHESIFRRLLNMASRHFPQLQPLIQPNAAEPHPQPKHAPTPETQPAPKHSIWATALTQVIAQIEWNTLLAALVSRFQHHQAESPADPSPEKGQNIQDHAPAAN